jgi:hypothetical protein
MPLIVLTLIIQVCFIVHVIRTGRPYWWAFVILSFPVAGCVIYYFVEIFPNSREHRSARKAAGQIARALKPDAELKRRIEEMETCGSAENKARLAEECLRMGFTEDAVRLYESSLTGPHANDPLLLSGLAQSALASEQADKASEAVTRLLSAHPGFRPEETRLLRARILEAQGRDDDALCEYEELVPAYVGLEAKYRYGQLLRRLGHRNQANSIFQDMVAYAKRVKISHEAELEWVGLARRSIEPDS